MTDSTAVASLLSWCLKAGYWIDPGIKIISAPHGVAVISQDTTIQADSILVRIPRESVLSVKSSPISDLIPPHPFGRGAQLSLALALSVELVKGTKSKWAAYLHSLPRDIPGIPLFWNGGATSGNHGDALEWLNGTEAAKALFGAVGNDSGLIANKLGLVLFLLLTSSQDEIREYFEQVAQPVYSKLFSEKNPSLPDFYLAYSLVSSRSFLVDAYHGLSMVPIADAFNHAQENHVHLESDFDVCPECGTSQRCVHDDMSDPVPRPQLPDDADDFYEMVANRAIPPNSEVFNTYGETLSNAELLVQYGFILDGNENDCLTWTFEELAQFSENYLPPRSLVGGLSEFQNLLRSINSMPWDLITASDMIYVDHTHAFCLNGDATMSHGLWFYFALLVCFRNSLPPDHSRNSIAVLLEGVVRCQLTLELRISSDEDVPPLLDDGASPYSVILELARLLVSFFPRAL
ncbi:hypothetical protein C8R43DRAFT_906832 [Mycena crocata]|nr:hypothetical protein C8R43DRAFT_906832 [Mycena crocata]